MRFKEGDYVRVVVREMTPADVKEGLFYPYFCGLAGTVDRVYDEEVCLKVDPESLPEDVLKRHISIQDSIKRKWLNNLSAEARNRLTPEEKQFELSYTILVRSSDLEKAKPGDPKPAAIKSLRPVTPAESTSRRASAKDEADEDSSEAAESDVEPAEQKSASRRTKTAPAVSGTTKPAEATAKSPTASRKGGAKEQTPKPVTEADLEAAERAFLEERAKALKGQKK